MGSKLIVFRIDYAGNQARKCGQSENKLPCFTSLHFQLDGQEIADHPEADGAVRIAFASGPEQASPLPAAGSTGLRLLPG